MKDYVRDYVRVVDGNVAVYFPPGYEIPVDKSLSDLVREQMEDFWISPERSHKKREVLGTPESVAPYQ